MLGLLLSGQIVVSVIKGRDVLKFAWAATLGSNSDRFASLILISGQTDIFCFCGHEQIYWLFWAVTFGTNSIPYHVNMNKYIWPLGLSWLVGNRLCCCSSFNLKLASCQPLLSKS